MPKLRTIASRVQSMYAKAKCCNIVDHIGLPIIHIKAYRHNRDKRQEHRCRTTDYIVL